MYIPDPNEIIFLNGSNPFSSHGNIDLESVFGSYGSMSSNSKNRTSSSSSSANNSNLLVRGKKRTNSCFRESKSSLVIAPEKKKYKIDGNSMCALSKSISTTTNVYVGYDEEAKGDIDNSMNACSNNTSTMCSAYTEHVDNSMYACSNSTRTTIDKHVEYCEEDEADDEDEDEADDEDEAESEAEDEVEANTYFDEVPVIDFSMHAFIQIVYNDVPYYIVAPSHLNQKKIFIILADWGINCLGPCKSFEIVSKPEYISIDDFIRIPHPDKIYVDVRFAHRLRGLI